MAITETYPDTTNEQSKVPEHGPDQPEKTTLTPCTACNVTICPTGYDASQEEPQFMPVGLLVTFPELFPAIKTDILYFWTDTDEDAKVVCVLDKLVPGLACTELEE